jgi:excisionase family DNA binding protein
VKRKLLRKKEAAERLGNIHPGTLDRYVKAGLLGSVKLGSLVFFTEADIEHFIRRCHRKPVKTGNA